MAKGKRTRGRRPRYSRALRKYKRKWQRKRLIRQLNSIAEKKIKVALGGQPPLQYNHAGANPGIALISDNLPTAGTGNNQRIGTKIFVRYVILEAFYSNVWPPDIELSGLFSHFIGKERYAYASEIVSTSDIAASMNGYPCVNPFLLKHTFKKMKLHHRHMYPNERRVIVGSDGMVDYHQVSQRGTHTNTTVFRKKFKIMRSVNIYTGGVVNKIDIPDIIWIPIYWRNDVTLFLGAVNFQYRLTMSFTDI